MNLERLPPDDLAVANQNTAALSDSCAISPDSIHRTSALPKAGNDVAFFNQAIRKAFVMELDAQPSDCELRRISVCSGAYGTPCRRSSGTRCTSTVSPAREEEPQRPWDASQKCCK
jgi:hypothetical protein